MPNPNKVGQDEFPEVEVTVAPITDRSRATLAKTHERPAIADFSAIFTSDSTDVPESAE